MGLHDPLRRRAVLPISLLALSALVSACGDDTADYPTLMPTDALLAEPAIPGHAGIAAQSPDQVVSDLQAAGAALAISATEVTAAASADDAALRGRADALAERAAQMRAEGYPCDDPTETGCDRR